MNKATDEILEKVKKLMALGNSPSEAEAASALEKARILLAKYGLSVADVDTSHSEVKQNILLEKKRLRKWESHLILVIASSTFTQAIHTQRNGGQVLIIGREVNTQAAINLFEYLHLTILKLGRDHGNTVSHLDSFRCGVVHRIGERLSSISSAKEDSESIWTGSDDKINDTKSTIDKDSLTSDRQLTIKMSETTKRENNEYISSVYGKTTNKKVGSRVDLSSYNKGRVVGDTVSLNRQIKH